MKSRLVEQLIRIKKNLDKICQGIGAGEENRTPDLLITNQLLYRLSHTSI